MNRRRWLGLAGTGAVSALAGCTVGYRGDSGGSTATPAAAVPDDELVRGAAKDAIPAITDPAFGTDWSGIEYDAFHPLAGQYRARPRLSDESLVVGVERGGEARAYPLILLNWHEVVNDQLEGPLLVTYCPLCGSAMTAVRTVDGRETTFGVSGLLYKNDLVMYDELTGSLWSQIEARAIQGPETGERLELVPSSLTTWGTWTREHPDTVVLRPPPESNTVRGPEASRNYDINPYLGYEATRNIGISDEEFRDDRLHPKATVVGIESDGVAKAYPLDRVVREGVVNDRVGDLPVVVTAVDEETLVAYDRRVDGRTLRFALRDGSLAAANTRWNPLTGVGRSGSLADATLESATEVSPLFFFAWLSFHPDTAVYGE